MLSSLLNIGAGALGKFLFQGVSLFAEHRKNKLNREYDLKERAMDLDFQRITLEMLRQCRIFNCLNINIQTTWNAI